MAEHRLQIVQLNEDGSAVVQAWAIPEEEAGRIRAELGDPDMEGFSPAEVIDAIIEAGQGKVVFSE